MESNLKLPFWTWIGGGLAVLCLFTGIVLQASADGMERGENYPKDADQIRTHAGLMDVSGTMTAIGGLVLGAILLVTGLAVQNPAWARVAFVIVGAATLVPINLL